MTEIDDLGLCTWLETEKGFTILAIKRTGLGKEIYTLDKPITPELVSEFEQSDWKKARERFTPPGHTM
jgi:hypothetical protein